MKKNMPWETDQFFTSPWNFAPEVRGEMNFAKEIKIHDITLRDGEQQAGVVFNKDQKVAIAEKLAEIGVHRIEAGMPAVTKSDQEAIKEIIKRNLGPEIFAFARCMKEDIDLAADCGCTGVIAEIPCSKHIIENAYKWTVERAIEQSIEVTQYAHAKGLKTIFFPIDATRADIDWFLDTISAIAKDGYMDAIALPDSIGAIGPHAVPFLVKKMKSRLSVPIELHFHDDFGLGTANTLFALSAGADVVHTTISGIGERAGNVCFEEVVMALKTMYDIDLGIDLSKLVSASKMIQEFSGLKFRPNRPIIGDAIFNLESGIPVAWYNFCKDHYPTIYAPYVPSMVGQSEPTIIMSKMSGLPNIVMWLDKLGIALEEDKHMDLLLKVKDLALTKGIPLTEDEFRNLAASV